MVSPWFLLFWCQTCLSDLPGYDHSTPRFMGAHADDASSRMDWGHQAQRYVLREAAPQVIGEGVIADLTCPLCAGTLFSVSIVRRA